MKKLNCLDEFIDWLSTNFWKSGRWTALQIAESYNNDTSSISEINELSGGCTNSSVRIKFYDDIDIKLTAYNESKSPYNINGLDFFLEERQLKNSLYKNEFNIIYDTPSIVISKYSKGESLNSILKSVINSGDLDYISNLNSKVINEITNFHCNMIKTHRTSNVTIAMLFLSTLKQELKNSIYFDVDLRSTSYIDSISDGINKILLFESKFEDSDFKLSHLDTDPVNILYCEESDKINLIDFEFTGVGLKYYDYVNYLNVLNSLDYFDSENDKEEIQKRFTQYCEKVISDFNHEDFRKSYNIMRFTWGIWYLMYGVQNEFADYISIGKQWVSDWINEGSVI